MSNGFGKPKYGGSNSGSTNLKYFDLKTDKAGGSVSYTFRLLPPMKSLAEEGKWAMYYGQHFGYAGTDSKDPTRTRQKPFRCIEEKNFKTQMITRACPECNLIRSKEDELKDKMMAHKAAGKSDEIIAGLVEDLTDFLKNHNRDSKWYINVMNAQGEFGVLRLSHRTKKLLETKIQAVMNEEGVDPLDLEQGVWFRFTRTGKKIEAQDSIDVEQEFVTDPNTGRKLKTLKLAPLTGAQVEQALKECPDLATVVREITEGQIRQLVATDGIIDPETVDEIFSQGARREGSASPKPVQAQQPYKPRGIPTPAPAVETAPVASVAAPVAAPVPAPAAPAPAPALDLAAQIAALQAQLAAAQAAPAPAAPAPAVTAPVAPAPSAPVAATPAPAPSQAAAEAAALPRDQFLSLFKK